MNQSELTLTIEAKAEIISSDFPRFAEMVRGRLSEINRELVTDDDFDKADADAKAIVGARKSLRAAKDHALASAQELYALFGQIDELDEEMAGAAKELSKQITKRKEERKTEIVESALATFDIDATLARKHYLPGLQAVVKGKRTVKSMETECRIYATTQQAMIGKCRQILDSFEKAHGTEMTMDRRTLELEKPEGLEAELRRRFEAKRAAEERKRLEKEAADARAAEAKAKAEAAAAIKEAEVGKTSLVNAAPAPAPAPANVVPMKQESAAVPSLTRTGGCIPVGNAAKAGPTAAEEWAEMSATVKSAFALIKEHRERLVHDANIQKIMRFGGGVNAAWQAANRGTEVAS